MRGRNLQIKRHVFKARQWGTFSMLTRWQNNQLKYTAKAQLVTIATSIVGINSKKEADS